MNLTDISRFISLILRHKPESIGITLDEHGWANVDELIDGISRTQYFDREMLEEIVRTDEKKRYSFNEDRTLIRANQGHSIPVDVELPVVSPPEILWHGTGEHFIPSIMQQGILRMNRLYVHLSQDMDTARAVGLRHGGELLILTIKAKEMWDLGIKFWQAKNGVYLTKCVDPKFIKE